MSRDRKKRKNQRKKQQPKATAKAKVVVKEKEEPTAIYPNTHRRHPWPKPELVLTPYVMAKLQWMCHHGDTEIAGYGVSEDQEELLVVHDLYLFPQECTSADWAVVEGKLGETMANWSMTGNGSKGRYEFAQIARILFHTHPGDSPIPSGQDEEAFNRIFFEHADASWAVMAILAKGGSTHARLRLGGGLYTDVIMPWRVDWSLGELPNSDIEEEWEKEYDDCVTEKSYAIFTNLSSWRGQPHSALAYDYPTTTVPQSGGYGMDLANQWERYESGAMDLNEEEEFEKELVDANDDVELDGKDIASETPYTGDNGYGTDNAQCPF